METAEKPKVRVGPLLSRVSTAVVRLNRVEGLLNRAEWRHVHFFSLQSLEVIFPRQEEIDPVAGFQMGRLSRRQSGRALHQIADRTARQKCDQ